MKLLLASAALLVATSAAFYAQTSQIPMRAGQWEAAMSMQMAGMTMPEFKSTSCITTEQLQKDPASGLPSGTRGGAADACKVSDYKVTGNVVSWKMMCSGAQAMNGEGEIAFTDDTYAGTIKMMMPQGAMSMKMTGKRLGDCPQ